MSHAPALAGLLPALAAVTGAGSERSTGLGVVTYSLSHHLRQAAKADRTGRTPAASTPPSTATRPSASEVLSLAQCFGAAGIQADLSTLTADEARLLRSRAGETGLSLEGIIAPPNQENDPAFENAVQATLAAGATVARTVLFPGRRYENFTTLAAFREVEQKAATQLRWAEPVLRQHRLKLAIENHKDQTTAEKLRQLEPFDPAWVGLCLDFGNNLSLCELPLATAQALAPRTFTVHIKDQAVQETPTGFLLADAALGQGSLPLAEMVRVVRAVNPAARFNLEVITRDALNVPIYTDAYWNVFPNRPAAELAEFCQYLKSRCASSDFPRISALPPDRQVLAERENITASVAFARTTLKL